jgi:hypothetical protein
MNWILLYKTSRYTDAAIIKGKLEENNIPVQVLNKQDSMYVLTLPGQHEVYVPGQYEELANSILNEVLKN